MYSEFKGLNTKINTQTDLILLLDDIENPTGSFNRRIEVTVNGYIVVTIIDIIKAGSQDLHLHDFDNTISVGDIPILIWKITEMIQEGNSVYGKVLVTPMDFSKTWGIVRQKRPNTETPFPAVLEAEVCAAFKIENYGILHNLTPVPIRADIDKIPPFGIEAKHQNSVILVDEKDTPKGMLVGRSITLLGLY